MYIYTVSGLLQGNAVVPVLLPFNCLTELLGFGETLLEDKWWVHHNQAIEGFPVVGFRVHRCSVVHLRVLLLVLPWILFP